MWRQRGTGDAGHQAQVGDEPIIGAEYGGAQRVTAETAMTAFEARQDGAAQRRRRPRR
jgi:hypothetical protein